jgi:hypothetical protein
MGLLDDGVSERRLIASTRKKIVGTSEDPTAAVPIDEVPAEVRDLLRAHPRPWRFDGHSLADADGDKINWSVGAMVLAIQAINAFDVDRQWRAR